MIIDITEKPANHCWVVCMDALQVNFNSQGEAQAFVGQLKARIEAPHVWPSVADPGVVGGDGAARKEIVQATDKNQVVGTRSNQSVVLLPD
ncbi:hypothetical protein [Pseudomonas sp. A-B-19]|uniref:hypothetical protein n=1 Tax=Pseudomonas sp. A-B-19 TaxID=2832405 RepID=UPI001CC149D4|nr:hypothetical protein [Pseudomonas sp. A-B-19]